MQLSRRAFLAAGGIAAGMVRLAGWPATARAMRAPGLQSAPLTLKAMPGEAQLLEANEPATRIWGYNASVPGPAIEAVQGEELWVRLENGLEQPTTIHWHGLRIANAMDGVPELTQTAVPPGGVFDYRLLPPDAGLYWYHSHNMGSEQLGRGLYGLLAVHEKSPPRADQDILLALDDWRIGDDGQIHASFGDLHDAAHQGRMGNVATVNGKAFLNIDVRARERLRLRLCNTANARIMRLRMEGHEPLVMAIDGQPCTPFTPADGIIELAPGQRADLLVDMIMAPGSQAPIAEVTGSEAVELAKFVYGAGAGARPALLPAPGALPANPLNTRPDFANARMAEILMEGGAMGGLRQGMLHGEMLDMRALAAKGYVWTFNGVAGHPKLPLFTARRGETVLLTMRNATAWPHAMHVHGHHFAKTANGVLPAGTLWRDTILSNPNETMTIAFVADNPGKWLIHCHMLEHHAAGMASWFMVE